MRQRAALSLAASREKEGAHARREAHADRVHRRLQVLHRVVDREAGGYAPTGGVDVHEDVAVLIVRLEEQQLRDDDVRHIVVDRRAEEDDAVHEEPREDVVAALAAAGALDDIRWVQCGHEVPHALVPLVISFRAISHSNTFSSVMLRSISGRRPAFCSDVYTWPGSVPRCSATPAIRSSTSFSVAVSCCCSAIASMIMSRRTCLSATAANSAPNCCRCSSGILYASM